MYLPARDLDAESERLINARVKFEIEYCLLRNWNIEHLTQHQMREIRKLLIWLHGLWRL